MPLMMAFVSLLFPFEWAHAFIPILPRSLLSLLQAPMPFFIGCHPSYLLDYFLPAPQLKPLNPLQSIEALATDPDYEAGLFIHTASGCFVYDDVGTESRIAMISRPLEIKDRDLVALDIDHDCVFCHPSAPLPSPPASALQKLNAQLAACGMEYLPRHPCIAHADALASSCWRLRGPEVAPPDERLLNAAVTLDGQPLVTEPQAPRRRERDPYSPPSRFSTRLKIESGSVAGSQVSWSRFGARSQLSDHSGGGIGCDSHRGVDYGDAVRQLRASAQTRIDAFLRDTEVLSEALFEAEGPGYMGEGLRTEKNEEILPLGDRLKAH